MPKSVISKIGASGSLLMAMMVLEVCMPARCWIAPEIPAARYSCGETVLPVWPTWNWCGYQPASVTAREAPTAAPSASASCSMTPNPSADPVPRPPETTICASVRSGRSPFSATTCSVIRVAFAASDSVTVTGETSAAPAAGSAVIAFGRTAMIGVPLTTRECTVIAPPKFGCSATGAPSSPATTLTASVSTPEAVLTASRPATSLPSRVPAISTAAGAFSATSEASSSAAGATTNSPYSALSATYTRSPPKCSARTSTSAIDPGPSQMNFRSARNAATLTPPSPSSLTITPAARGGRAAKSATAVADPPSPTASAPRPMSASDSVCTGFFFAAMIPLNEGYLGSLIFSTTDTTAGSEEVTTAYPSSVTRLIVADVPSMSTFDASVSCGTPSCSASMAGSTPLRASVDSDPQITRSNPTCFSAAAIAADVASASDPARPSSLRWTALSAPIDSALRMDSDALAGPIEKIVTSPPCASAIRSPSSIAYSSSSLMSPSGVCRSSVPSPGLSVRSTAVSGTCLTQTTMFMDNAALLRHRLPEQKSMLLASSKAPFCRLHHICQQHRAGHGAYSAGHRGYPAGDRSDVGRDVTHQAGLGPRDPHVQHGRPRADHVRGQQPRPACRHHHDIGGASVRGKVFRPGVAERNGRVLRPPGEQQPERPPHGDAAAHHGDVGSGDLDAVLAQQHHDAMRRARQRALLAQHELAQVDRVQPVGVLGRVHQVQHALVVQPGGQRKLDDVPGAGLVLVELEHRLLDLRLRGVGLQIPADRGDAHLRAVPVLARDVRVRTWVVPDQDRAKPRHDPAGGQRGHPLLQVRLDLRGGCLPVQNRCAHRQQAPSGRNAGPR